MPDTFFIADQHFGHESVLTKHKKESGEPLRPFSDLDEMHQELIGRWNNRVRKNDTAYVLGDVTMKKRYLEILDQLHGRKILIPGNHDDFPFELYLQHFDGIRVYKAYDDFVCTHVPLHPESLKRWGGHNVHGHLHDKRVRVTNSFGRNIIDPRYLCVSVEQTDFAPINLAEVRRRIELQNELVGQ